MGGFCKGLSEHGFGGLAEAFFIKHDDVQHFVGGIAVIGDGGDFDCVFQVAVIAPFLPRVLHADGGQIAQASVSTRSGSVYAPSNRSSHSSEMLRVRMRMLGIVGGFVIRRLSAAG